MAGIVLFHGFPIEDGLGQGIAAVDKLEGEEGEKYIDEYLAPKSERGKKLREAIRKELNLTSVEFQSLDGVIEAIGLEPCKLCTYCWNGKE